MSSVLTVLVLLGASAAAASVPVPAQTDTMAHATPHPALGTRGTPARDTLPTAEASGHAASDGKACAGASTGGSGATGLRHAIDVVAANCRAHPQAPGLANALTHLKDNARTHGASHAGGGSPAAGGNEKGAGRQNG